MNRKLQRLGSILLTLALLFSLTACSQPAPADTGSGTDSQGETSQEETGSAGDSDPAPAGDGSLQRVLDAGKLMVACESAWVPYAYVDTETNVLTGYDVEIAREVGKRLGVEVEFMASNVWDGIVASLNSKRVDCIFNGTNIYSRIGTYNMTQPYMENKFVLTVGIDSDIDSFEDLDGKVVANALEGSCGKLAMDYGATLTEAHTSEAMILIRDGRADANIDDFVVIGRYMETVPEMKDYVKQVCYYETENRLENQVGGTFRLEDKDLCDAVNEALGEMREDGTMRDLAAQFLSEDVAANLEVVQPGYVYEYPEA